MMRMMRIDFTLLVILFQSKMHMRAVVCARCCASVTHSRTATRLVQLPFDDPCLNDSHEPLKNSLPVLMIVYQN